MQLEEWRKVPRTLAFSNEEYQGRVERVRGALADRGLEALLLFVPESLCYLTGFQTPGYYFVQALIIPGQGSPKLVTRYLEQANAIAFSWLDRGALVAYLDHHDPIDSLIGVLRDLGLDDARLGIEKQGFGTLSIARYDQLVAGLPNATLVDGSGIVESVRAIKSPVEIAYIRKACRISSIAMRAAVDHCRAGMSEFELAGHVDKALADNGGEYAGLPLLLSSGARTYIRHAVPQEKVIDPGDNVLVELTGVTWRYAGPLFRTISVGPPSAELVEHSNVARDMLDALIDGIRPGRTSHEVNAVAVEISRRASQDVSVLKRAGYSVGLNFAPDWGEGGFLDLRTNNDTVLEAGMVFHLPQTVRVRDALPTAVSETVLVTETGCEVLTDFEPRNLIVVD